VVWGLPSFVVEGYQLAGGMAGVVEQAGDQPPLLAAGGAVGQGDGDRCLDDPDRDQGREDAVAGPGQVGAVWQAAAAGGQRRADERTRNCAPAARTCRRNSAASKPASASKQHRGIQRAQQPVRIAQLAGAFGAEGGSEQGTGAAPGQGQQPQQRVPELQALPGALAITPGEHLIIGDVQEGAIDGHGAQPTVERPGLPGAGHRPGQRLKQPPQRRSPDPAPGARQRGRARLRHGQPFQPSRQLAPHSPVRAAPEQRQRKHEVHHHPRRQQPALPGSGLLQDRIHQREADHLGQLAEMAGREHSRAARMVRVMTDSSCNGTPEDRRAWQQDDLQESRSCLQVP
jgi:hypothetical protein